MLLTPAGGGGGGVLWKEEEWTPTSGQVTFILSQAPADPKSTAFYVNGNLTDETGEWSISGQNITWLDTLYTLQPDDHVVIRYK